MEHEPEELLSILFNKDLLPSEANKLVHKLFESPKTLMTHLSSLKHPHTWSALDVERIAEMYARINQLNQDSELLVLYNNILNQLAGETAFREYLHCSEQLKFFFVVILWGKLFSNKDYQFVTLRVLEFIQKGSQYSYAMKQWMEDLTAEQIKCMLVMLHSTLESTVKKLTEQEQTLESNLEISRKSETICYFMKLLSDSNRSKQRVHLKQFNNIFLTDFFQPEEQFRIYLEHKKNKDKQFGFNFLKYPFLLNFEYKHKLLQFESIIEQKISMRNNMQRGLSALIQDFDGGNFGIEGLLYLCIKVHRENLLDDSMEKLGKVKQNLRSPLKIEFIGEEGADQGGVKNEYFALLTKQIFNPYLDMFVPKSNGRFYWFYGFSSEMPIRFEFVGMLLGLALYNGVHLDIHFPEIIFKKLLNPKYEEDYTLDIIEDLKEIEPEIYVSLKDILTTSEPLDDLELYFNIQLEYFGDARVEELVEEGNQIKVTLDNREEYCLMYADYLLNKHIEKQFTPFRKGFNRVVEGSIIDTFQPAELSVLINGKEEININELEESTTYQGGYTKDTPVIRYLWEFLHGLNHEEKKNFLTFVTGTDRVPINGLKNLKFNIQRHSNTTNLPTAHTCFNVMLLPEYDSKQQLFKSMRLILEHNQGFGLI